jgi:CelD/BcsL family acetyltransferase involved in cellulose biosynthesis
MGAKRLLSHAENSAAPRSAARNRAAAAPFSRVEIFRDFASAEPDWRKLEASGSLTPYQRYCFLSLWQTHIGDKEGIEPLIVVAYDHAGEPLCLLPLGKFTRGPFAVARFLAGKHANYNFGPWRKGVQFDRAFVEAIIEQIAAAAPELAALELFNQPLRWHGTENPFLQFPHQPSPSAGYRLRLAEPGEAVLARQLSTSYRGRIRGKERKLAKLPGYRYFVVSTAEEAQRVMDAFFAQKREYLALHKTPNPFESPEVEAFLRAATLAGLENGKPVLEIHALEGGGEVLALYAGVANGERLSTMISSYTSSENAKNSPGIITLSHAVANVADRGFAIMDLGVGEAEYKFVYCDESEDLFDSFLPLSAAGHAITPLLRAQSGLKRMIKSTPVLWRAAKTVRGLLQR